MTVGRICSRKTYLAQPKETVRVAAERMKAENVGCLVVADSSGRTVGILTDRDIAVRVVAEGRDPQATSIDQVMSAHPRCVEEETPIEDAVSMMRTLGVRRVPVVDAGEQLIGIVSVDDVLELVSDELAGLATILGMSQPGMSVPATAPRSGKSNAPAPAGLERASADLEC